MTPDAVYKIIGDTPFMTRDTGQWFYDLIKSERIYHILEIGTFHGAGTCYLGGAVQDTGGHVVTVDLPWSASLQPNARTLLDKCGIPAKHATVLRRSDGAAGFLKSWFGGDFKPLDLVYIDGAHEFEPTLTFGALALAAVRPGGWLVFDDIGSFAHPDVQAVWELVQRWPGLEFSTFGRMGICHLLKE